jgi:nucleotide-binding universal stress UspA family protein
MTTRSERPAGGRILVALDASPRSLAALSTAGALAAELDAELAGLFVEDINLQRLLALPFAREFCLLSGELRPLSQAEIERTWRREAETLQRRLAEAAEHLQLRWSFQVARGRMATEVSLQAQAFDLIVLGERAGVSVMAAVQTTTRVKARVPDQAGPVLVLFESCQPAAASLDLGIRLARRIGAELVMLIHAADEAAYRSACTAAQAALKARGAAGRCVWLTELARDKLVGAARREAASCLVLADRNRFLQQGELERVLDEIDCPVVLSR